MGEKERKVEKYLDDRVKEAGGFTRKYTSPGVRGVPDRIVFLKGVHFVECKAPGKATEAHQRREHVRMQRQGAAVFVVDSEHMVDAVMRAIEKGVLYEQ